MRRAGLLLALVMILASSASPAAAHRSPALCTSNSADLTLIRDRTIVRPGDTITYAVMVSNAGLGACDITGATASLQLPAADGTPTGAVVPLNVGVGDLPAGTPSTQIGNVEYAVAVNPLVDSVIARVEGSGVLHDAPVDHNASVNKTIGTVSTQPSLSFTFGASPPSGFAPFTTTYEFRVTNTSTTNVPMAPPAIQHTSCPAVYADGDGNPIGQLDNDETWRYTCTRLFPTPLNFSSTATAAAQSKVDDQSVLAPPSGLVSVTAARPPAATLELSRIATPLVGPAPLTVTHTYTLRNTSGADPRPVKNPAVVDGLCAPVARTPVGDDLLSAGETWTYTCTQTLLTPQTVSGTAVASGPDDLGFNVVSISNEAEIQVEATTVNPGPTPTPTPTPGATPTPTPTPGATATPTPTPRPSTRVNLATTSGRLARPCGKTARAQLKVAKRVIATKRVRLDNRCRYRVRFTNVARSRLRGATRVTVTVRSGRRTATHRVAVPTR